MTDALHIVPARDRLPSLVAAAGAQAQTRFLEFFAAQIRKAHTHRAHAQAAQEFLEGRASAGVASIADIKPLHVAAYVEQLTKTHSAPTVKQRLAAIRHLFDWLVVGHVIEHNPAHSVRGPTHRVKRGKTPVLDASEARALIGSIDTTTPVGLCDRALIGSTVHWLRLRFAVAVEGPVLFGRDSHAGGGLFRATLS